MRRALSAARAAGFTVTPKPKSSLISIIVNSRARSCVSALDKVATRNTIAFLRKHGADI